MTTDNTDNLDENEIAQKEEEEVRSKSWAKAVKKRDRYRCVVCGRKSRSIDEKEDKLILHSHHVFSWSDNPDLRFLYSNGITLCETCHESFHIIYGKGGNNRYQFTQFKNIIEEMIRANKSKIIQEKIEILDGYQSHQEEESNEEIDQQISPSDADESFSFEEPGSITPT